MLPIIFKLLISYCLITLFGSLSVLLVTDDDFEWVEGTANTKLARAYAIKALVSAGMVAMAAVALLFLLVIWGF